MKAKTEGEEGGPVVGLSGEEGDHEALGEAMVAEVVGQSLRREAMSTVRSMLSGRLRWRREWTSELRHTSRAVVAAEERRRWGLGRTRGKATPFGGRMR